MQRAMIKGTQDDRPATDVLAFDFESRAQHSNPRVVDRHDAASLSQWLAPVVSTGRRWGVRLLALLTGIAFWHYATTHALNVYVRFENVPTPLSVAEAFVTHLCESSFYLHIAASLKRIAVSYALATGVGVLLGVAMGRSNIIRDIASPNIEILRPIPAVA